MTLDDVIRHNEKLLAELEARQDLARAAEALHRMDEKSAPKVENPEAKATPPEHDAPQTYQTQTYEVTAPNEVVVTQEARLPESPQDIQALIDIVKKNLELLEQIKDAKEVDKESVTQLIVDWKDAGENNEYYQKHFKEMMTPDQTFVYDASSQPMDPITAAILVSGVAAGLVSDSRGGKWIAETAKEFGDAAIEDAKASYERQKMNIAYEVEKTKEAYETAKQDIKDGIELQKINVAYEKVAIKEGVEKAKEAIKDTWEKAKDMVGDMAAALADPALAAKEKEQAAARDKLEADLKKQMEFQEKRWDEKGVGEKEKAELMQKAEKAAQAMRDQMIAKQAEELERMRRMEEAHRARW